jgi:hypothetical protein
LIIGFSVNFVPFHFFQPTRPDLGGDKRIRGVRRPGAPWYWRESDLKNEALFFESLQETVVVLMFRPRSGNI